MVRVWLKCIILLFLFTQERALCQEEEPFWRQNAKLYEQITKSRRIVVSSKDEVKKGSKLIRLMGAGLLNAPLSHCVQEITQFENLTKVSNYFKKVVHKKEKQQLYIFVQAFGYQSRFLLNYKWTKQEARQAQLDWVVVWGRLKGTIGHFQLKEIEAGKTEISLWSLASDIDFPLPDFLMNFTLEVIAEKVAQKMRTYIEESYQEQVKVKKNG